MLRYLLATSDDPTPLVARLALGIVILPHGLQKTLGWFGGTGFSGTMQFFTENLGIPSLLALLAIAVESVGALALLAGLTTRAAALGTGVTMAVAAVLVHLDNGFFMNWYGNQAGEGFEFHILAVGLAVLLSIRGGGKLSLDRILAARFQG